MNECDPMLGQSAEGTVPPEMQQYRAQLNQDSPSILDQNSPSILNRIQPEPIILSAALSAIFPILGKEAIRALAQNHNLPFLEIYLLSFCLSAPIATGIAIGMSIIESENKP